MRVLFIYSINRNPMPFVIEQKDSLIKSGVTVQSFEIKGKGISGYLKNIKLLRKAIKKEAFDVIHAHYGLAGLISILQRSTPVVVTYHGSDIYLRRNKLFSLLVSRCVSHNIFVSNKMYNKLNRPKNSSVIPCGVDINIFKPLDKKSALALINLSAKTKYILFSSSFTNPVKNYPLAEAALCKSTFSTELLELKNLSRAEVNMYLNACDLLLLTSHTEGSPQVIKEAMASNTPIVSVDVGDVDERLKDVTNSYVTLSNAKDLASNIDKVLLTGQRSNGRDKIKSLDLEVVALKIISVYKNVIKNS